MLWKEKWQESYKKCLCTPWSTSPIGYIWLYLFFPFSLYMHTCRPSSVLMVWCSQICYYGLVTEIWFSNFPVGTSGKESACQCRRCKRHRFDPWVQKIPGEGHGSPLQYSCLENPMQRVAWWAIVHRVAHSWTWLKKLSMQARSLVT